MTNLEIALLMSLLPYLVGIPFAVFNYYIALRLGKSAMLWAILTLIPLVNLFFIYYVGYCVIVCVLDRLDAIAKRVGVTTA